MKKEELQSILDRHFPDKVWGYMEDKHLYKNMGFAIREQPNKLITWYRGNNPASAIFYLGGRMFSEVNIRIL